MQRLRRWAKKLGLVVLELFVVLTLASVAYNLATADRVKPASAFYGGPFVSVDGKQVAFRRWGARGTPVVLLGGFIVPSSVWEAVARRLSGRHRVFAVDLPPFGYTERKGPYTLDGWVHLVHDFDRRLGLQRPFLSATRSGPRSWLPTRFGIRATRVGSCCWTGTRSQQEARHPG